MSATQAFADYYSLNSPDPGALSPSSSSSSPRVSNSSSRSSLAPPPNSYKSDCVFSPNETRPLARRSAVQIQGAGPVNWSRPFPASPPGLVSSLSPKRSSTPPIRKRTVSANLTIRPHRATAASPVSLSSSDEDTPMTPHLLPPGAASPERAPPVSQRSWAVMSECKGLGMLGIAEFDQQKAVGPDESNYASCVSTVSSRSSSEGSLAGDSMRTASSSGSTPTTPTRLLFVSEILESLSNPATLDELRSLRAKVAELDLESKRLQRLKGREPVVYPRNLPRKAVPVITPIELQAPPKPRRPAVRHSLLIVPSQPLEFDDPISEPLKVPTPDPFTSSASRRPFYAQGKAAMSVIEFSSRKEEPVAYGRARNVIPSFGSMRREKDKTAGMSTTNLGSYQTAPVPRTQPAPQQRQPQPAPQHQPQPQSQPQSRPHVQAQPEPQATVERTVSVKTSNTFLNRHKKLSRFLGKPQPA